MLGFSHEQAGVVSRRLCIIECDAHEAFVETFQPLSSVKDIEPAHRYPNT
jgi:hypothetical protein